MEHWGMFHFLNPVRITFNKVQCLVESRHDPDPESQVNIHAALATCTLKGGRDGLPCFSGLAVALYYHKFP